MEDEETKLCSNCKREIPSVNFTTHSVHCARNLRACPVCKEPVPTAQLNEHHDALHKEVPCKKCGESVCGTDLEDHIRDSCAQTIKPCRYCELELPRRSLPSHEAYCGARSEQCPDCREYVMAKYRQLHLDSNHGFIRLDDDPTPKEAKPKPKPVTNGVPLPSTSRNGTNQARPVTEIRHYETQGSSAVDSRRNGKVIVKRTNDQPQINTNVQPAEKVNKELPSRGAVKKRPAPPPPPDARRDNAYSSAARRKHQEDKQRQEQTAYNLSVGLPPVLSPAAKLDKLRKMDALHNREADPQEWRSKLQGRVWQPADAPAGHVLGRALDAPPRAGRALDQVEDLSHLQPMTPAQFMNRFQELQLGGEARANGAGAAGGGAGAGGDRFSEIKSSLRELRRGLNEVTAPYNSVSNATNNTNIDSNRLREPSPPADPGPLRLPCEFCGAAVPADDLVLHQTGCRPDLTQYKPRPRSPRSPRSSRSSRSSRSPRPPPDPEDPPVIPCEFCTESLPVYLISEHQERCRRETNILFPD